MYILYHIYIYIMIFLPSQTELDKEHIFWITKNAWTSKIEILGSA